MSLTPPNQLDYWQRLNKHFLLTKSVHMREQFATDPTRFERFALEFGPLMLDYAKNRIDTETMRLLMGLAREAGLNDAIKAMFAGDKVNVTENRAALHVALRNRVNIPITVDGKDVMPAVNAVLGKMRAFVEAVHTGKWRGHTGKRIEHIVNIGIGGSDLGAQMATVALTPYWQPGLKPHFVANIDGADITETLAAIDPQSSLFVVASKSFISRETMANAEIARRWLIEQLGSEAAVKKHFVAVSTQAELVTRFGIAPENMFEFWDWVGGRYSLWSAIGLPIALMIGMDNFEALLDGAHDMDIHFRDAPFENNMPVIMAMLGIWYRDFHDCASYAVLPYDHHLRKLPAYLQQSDMESNGKCVSVAGETLDYHTGPVIWGAAGANGQHAFYQLIHQGTQLIPADFIVPVKSHYQVSQNGAPTHHQSLVANAIAQTEALMTGRTRDRVETDYSSDLVPHCTFAGNRPSNTLLVEQITPQSLGSLIALYEHKIYTQGVIWRVNSFDQWGVELGKKLATAIEPELQGKAASREHDSSTQNLIRYCLKQNTPSKG